MKNLSTQSAKNSIDTTGVTHPQAKIEYDVSGFIISANDKFLELMNYSWKDIQKQHHKLFLSKQFSESEEYKKFWTSLQEGKHCFSETKRIANFGREVWLQSAYLPIEDEEGKIIKISNIVSDITLQKKENLRNLARIEAVRKSQSVIEFDRNGIIQTANDNFLDLMGYKIDDITGKHHSIFVDDNFSKSKEYKKFWDGLKQGNFQSGEFKRKNKSGDEIWIQGTYSPILDENGDVLGVTKLAYDISERVKLLHDSQINLKIQNSLMNERKLLSQMSEWLFCTQSMGELKTVIDASMPHLFPNSIGALYIYSNSRDVLDMMSRWGDINSNSHFTPNECWALRRGRAYSFGTREVSIKCDHVSVNQGVYYCLPITAHGDTIGLLHIEYMDDEGQHKESKIHLEHMKNQWNLAVSTAEQISLAAANVRLQERLEDMSVKDSLTGLCNRRWFVDYARKEIKTSVENGDPLCIISLDVDHFKKFNDNFGHDAGDEVLKELSSLLLDHFFGKFIPCRIGGEEFAIVASKTTAAMAKKEVEKFSERLKVLDITHANRKLPTITISAGVACLKKNETLNQLLKRADTTLYQAKEEGRNRCLIHVEN
jgi:diguanylate cyclase (GGDEF)-like protein/PAS domain S-box-containing protein